MTTPVFIYEAPFELPDVLVDVSGRQLCTGTRARVVHLLAITASRRYRHAIGSRQSDPGVVPEFLLHQPWSGGGEGKRRMREAHQLYGVEYDFDRFEPADGGGSTTMVYRLIDLGEVGGYPTLTGGSPLRATASAATPAPIPIVRFSDDGGDLLEVPASCASEDDYLAVLRELWAAGRLTEEHLCRQPLRRPTSIQFDPTPAVQRALDRIGLRWEGM